MMDRRSFLALASAASLQPFLSCPAGADTGPGGPVRRIMFVHGRDQQDIDPEVLKAQWMDALGRGAQSLGRQVPEHLDVSFPYYAKVLDQYTHGIPTTEDVQARGDNQTDQDFLSFEFSATDEMRKRAGISDQQLDELYGSDPHPKGAENWRWVHAVVKAIDKYGFGMSGTTIEATMRDVYLYTSRGGVRNQIDQIVKALLTEEPTIVVGHSLGSVVAYNVLRTYTSKLQVPLFVTLGSPLAIRAVRDQLVPIGYPKPPVALAAWNNALDTRDIVALYPLDQANFPVNPAVKNYDGVKNHTDNRHGIAGYLDDPTVAGWLLDAIG
jgi:hypothetical protein